MHRLATSQATLGLDSKITAITPRGTDTLVIQEGILGHTSRVLIVDDLIATGGSMIATSNLIEKTGARVEGAMTIINLKYINGIELDALDIWSALEIEK